MFILPEYISDYFARAEMDGSGIMSRDALTRKLGSQSELILERARVLGYQLPLVPSNPKSHQDWLLELLTIEDTVVEYQFALCPNIEPRFFYIAQSFKKRVELIWNLFATGFFHHSFKRTLPTWPLSDVDEIVGYLEGYAQNAEPEPSREAILRILHRMSAPVYSICAQRGYDLSKPFTGRPFEILNQIVQSWTSAICIRARSGQNGLPGEPLYPQILNQRSLFFENEGTNQFNLLMGGYYDRVMKDA